MLVHALIAKGHFTLPDPAVGDAVAAAACHLTAAVADPHVITAVLALRFFAEVAVAAPVKAHAPLFIFPVRAESLVARLAVRDDILIEETDIAVNIIAL